MRWDRRESGDVRTSWRRPAIGPSDRADGGFTLIVIAVVGILAAVAVFALGGMASTSAVAACNTDAKTVQTAVAAYDAQAGNEPSGTIAVSAAGVASDVAPGTALEQLVTAYLKNWPDNTGANYSITLDNPSVASPAIQTPGQVDVQVGGGAINPYSASACVGATT